MSSLGEGPRHEARERALAMLYEAELKVTTATDLMSSFSVAPDPFAQELVAGSEKNAARIDALVQESSVGWELDRMPIIDKTVLRLATYELIAHRETSVAVIIDEAVELAKRYSTEDSGRFVNGVLSAIAAKVRD